MKSTPEQREEWKKQSRTRKLVSLVNKLDILKENSRVSLAEVHQAFEQHRHVMDGLILLKIDAIRRAN